MFETSTLLFGICEFGERVKMSFEETRITIDQLKWYFMPSKIRKILPTILIVAQEPVEFKVFGSISSNRITFKEVSTYQTYQQFIPAN